MIKLHNYNNYVIRTYTYVIRTYTILAIITYTYLHYSNLHMCSDLDFLTVSNQNYENDIPKKIFSSSFSS